MKRWWLIGAACLALMLSLSPLVAATTLAGTATPTPTPIIQPTLPPSVEGLPSLKSVRCNPGWQRLFFADTIICHRPIGRDERYNLTLWDMINDEEIKLSSPRFITHATAIPTLITPTEYSCATAKWDGIWMRVEVKGLILCTYSNANQLLAVIDHELAGQHKILEQFYTAISSSFSLKGGLIQFHPTVPHYGYVARTVKGGLIPNFSKKVEIIEGQIQSFHLYRDVLFGVMRVKGKTVLTPLSKKEICEAIKTLPNGYQVTSVDWSGKVRRGKVKNNEFVIK